LLATKPVFSRLSAIGKLYDPLTRDEQSELITLMQKTDKFADLPDWAKTHLITTQILYEEEKAELANNKFTKHQSGEHDQATHGRKGGLGVPDYVDIEGKRYSKEAVAEFTKRQVAYETALDTKFDEILVERYGKPWSELDSYQQDEARSRTRYDEKGFIVRNPDGSEKRFPNVRDEANSDPKVAELDKAVQDHYLMKDAMGQKAWNEDGTLGPKTIGEKQIRGEDPREFATRMIRNQDESYRETDDSDYSKATNVLKRDSNGNFIRGENGRTESEAVLVSKQNAERINNEEWQAFGEAAYPEVIVSNKSLRSILASGEFKTYTEVDRPVRAGANDAEYKNARAAYESVAFGYNNDVDTANRPVSGLLTAFDPHQDLLKGYGNTQVVLKNSVLSRTTVTYDDSLNGFYQPKTVGAFLSKAPQYNNKSVASDVTVNGKGYYTNRSRGVYNTPEIQIHGGVKTSDIARVIFRDTVPAALSTKLDGLGIPYEVKTIEDAQE
jgi:hypothetical protein